MKLTVHENIQQDIILLANEKPTQYPAGSIYKMAVDDFEWRTDLYSGPKQKTK